MESIVQMQPNHLEKSKATNTHKRARKGQALTNETWTALCLPNSKIQSWVSRGLYSASIAASSRPQSADNNAEWLYETSASDPGKQLHKDLMDRLFRIIPETVPLGMEAVQSMRIGTNYAK